MSFLTFWPISNNQSIRGSANYYFSESSSKDEQFDTLLKKIGVTLFFLPCTNSKFTFDLWSSITREPWVALKKEKQFWNPEDKTNDLIYLTMTFAHFDILTPILSHGVILKPPYFKMLNDAKVASSRYQLRRCQGIQNTKNIAGIRNFLVFWCWIRLQHTHVLFEWIPHLFCVK